MMKRQLRIATLLAVAVATLAACGGGGSDAPATTYNVDAAFKSLAGGARSFTLAGTATNGSALALTWTIAPKGPAIFPLTGTTAQRVDTSIVIRSGSTVLAEGSQQSYFDAAMKGLGSMRSDGSCSSSTNVALPTAAAPGAGGDMGGAVVYATCSSSSPTIGQIAGEWALQKSDDLVFLCASTRLKDAAGAVVSRETDCVEIAPDGAIGGRARIDVDVLGTAIRFAN